MRKDEFIKELNQKLNDKKPFSLFVEMENQRYLEIKKEEIFKSPQFIFLDFNTETEFENKSIADLCKYFGIELSGLNRYITGYTLHGEEIVQSLFPKTKFLLNIFISTRMHEVVLFPLAGLSQKTVLEWKENLRANYGDKKIVVFEVPGASSIEFKMMT